MIDSSHLKVHVNGAGAKGGITYGTPQRRLNTKLHFALDAHGILVRAFITPGPTADCTQAERLIEGFYTEYSRFSWILREAIQGA